MKAEKSFNDFTDGLVFGFDVGTGSIGYAVRRGTEFKDVGVLICDSEGSDLSKRRDLRRQRRTLRSKKTRRKWFAQELAKLGLPKPAQPPHDPITLRVHALNGDNLKPEELHAALAHLFKRRGYSKVPWANEGESTKENAKPTKDDDLGKVLKGVEGIRKEMADRKCEFPCQLLKVRQSEAGQSPQKEWGRKIYWPRDLLENEFHAIAEAQKKNFPQLAEKKDWLLYGDTKEVKGHHVYFKTTEARNPGVMGLRWPRFDNRGPALDSLQPVDEQGHPLHVVRKNKEAFIKAQWELALMNFRVLDANTRQKIDPRIHFPIFIENLHNEWNKKKNGISIKRLGQLAAPFTDKFVLIENQKALTPETNTGRARYASPTLKMIQKDISAGKRVDPPQPILKRKNESSEDALNRYLADIKHPLVRHRLVLFRRLLKQLVENHGQPDMIVLEAVRSLALGQKAKNELNKRNETFRKERENAREQLASNNESFSRKAIQRYRLWKEAGGRCPFCLETIERTDLGHGADIEHLVPRAIVDCNEFYNLTVAHIKCNRELKGERTPYAAFNGSSHWADIKDFARKTFSGRKLEIFLSPNAEELIERKSDLQHTAYIARVIRHISLIQLGWLNDAGRDPTIDAGNKPSVAFQVTNGQLTSRLRKAWGLNQILHPLPSGKRWDDLSEEEQKQFTEKNRGDLRHHALDAMVIACTLPWLAHRTYGAMDEFGRHGWWTQDEKHRSKAANPIFGERMHDVVKKEIEKVAVKHHVSRSNHRRGYDTTIYGRKSANIYVAREKLTDLKEKDLSNIYPEIFGIYISAAWERFKTETINLNEILKATKGVLPALFAEKLCFSHFQKWRVQKSGDFYWPKQVIIPIRSVKYIGVHDDKSVSKASPGTHGYVARGGFKEVRIHKAADGKNWVPVFVPYWKGDRLIHDQPYQPGKPNKIIRIGDSIELPTGYGANNPPGIYRVVSTMQKQIQLMPPHIADTKEALKASGYLENGINLRWPAFFKATGYELPHPPSIKPQPESPNQA